MADLLWRAGWTTTYQTEAKTFMAQTNALDLCEHCPLNMKIELAISQHERRLSLLENDVKDLLAIAAQFKLLLSLSIGGGGLSIITLIMFLIKLSSQ